MSISEKGYEEFLASRGARIQRHREKRLGATGVATEVAEAVQDAVAEPRADIVGSTEEDILDEVTAFNTRVMALLIEEGINIPEVTETATAA